MRKYINKCYETIDSIHHHIVAEQNMSLYGCVRPLPVILGYVPMTPIPGPMVIKSGAKKEEGLGLARTLRAVANLLLRILCCISGLRYY